LPELRNRRGWLERAGVGSVRGQRPKFRQSFRLFVPAYNLMNNPG
jgi:hypothetical protein